MRNTESASLGRLLLWARQERLLRQGDVAQHLGVTQSVISKLEADASNVAWSTIVKLARLYRKPLQYFLDGQLRPPPTLEHLAVELEIYGLRDLSVGRMAAPSVLRRFEEVVPCALTLGEPRVVDAIPALLLVNMHLDVRLLAAFAHSYDVVNRVGWAADIARTLARLNRVPMGAGPALLRTAQAITPVAVDSDDTMGLGGGCDDPTARRIGRRWHVDYPQSLDGFASRARSLMVADGTA